METILDTLIAVILYLPIGVLVLLDLGGLRIGRYDASSLTGKPGA